MSQQKEKSGIKKRIKSWLHRNLFSPVSLPIIVFFAFIITYLVLEILTSLNILLFSYKNVLENLDYSKAKDIVTLIVTSDASLIAFTGVIATMILKHVLQTEKEGRSVSPPPKIGKDETITISIDPKYRRREIIKFIEVILLTLTASIGFGLGALMTGDFVFSMLLSFTFLLMSIIEVAVMLVFALEVEV
jgi:hypothetical protein